MATRTLAKRYEEFCSDAQRLLTDAGLTDADQEPNIRGRAFYDACVQLVTLHFPEDRPHGTGPRGLIVNTFSSFTDEHRKSPFDIHSSTRALGLGLQQIMNRKPRLDRWPGKPKGDGGARMDQLRKCSSYEPTRKYALMPELIFVLMPFREPWSDRIWNEHIRSCFDTAREETPVEVRRADDMYGQGVMEDVYEGIVRARLVVAECTGRNPNVLYELGMAHTLGKRTALLSQNEADIPFDLRRFRFCIYQDNSSGYPILHKFLLETLKDAMGQSV